MYFLLAAQINEIIKETNTQKVHCFYTKEITKLISCETYKLDDVMFHVDPMSILSFFFCETTTYMHVSTSTILHAVTEMLTLPAVLAR